MGDLPGYAPAHHGPMDEILRQSITINKEFTSAPTLNEMLDRVCERQPLLNNVNICTALSRLAKATSADLELRRTTLRDPRFELLLGMTEQKSPHFSGREASNAMWSIAKIAVRDDRMRNLMTTFGMCVFLSASQLVAQEISNVMWSYSQLALKPSDELFAALEARIVQLPGQFEPQHITNIMQAYAKLALVPGPGVAGAMGRAGGFAPAGGMAAGMTRPGGASLADQMRLLESMERGGGGSRRDRDRRRSRSRSRDRRRSRSRDRDRRRSRSRDKKRRSRSRSRDKKRRSRSKSREKKRRSRSRSQDRHKSSKSEPEKAEDAPPDQTE